MHLCLHGGFLPVKIRGKKTEGYILLADWYGTFCNLAGVDMTDKKAADAMQPPACGQPGHVAPHFRGEHHFPSNRDPRQY